MSTRNINLQDQMFNHVKNWIKEQGNITKKEFCRKHGFTTDAFYYWIKKYKSQNSSANNFVPVQILTDKQQISFDNKLIIEYPNNVKLKLPIDITPSIIISLIKNY